MAKLASMYDKNVSIELDLVREELGLLNFCLNWLQDGQPRMFPVKDQMMAIDLATEMFKNTEKKDDQPEMFIDGKITVDLKQLVLIDDLLQRPLTVEQAKVAVKLKDKLVYEGKKVSQLRDIVR